MVAWDDTACRDFKVPRVLKVQGHAQIKKLFFFIHSTLMLALY